MGKNWNPVLYTKQSEDENVAEIFRKRLWNDIEKVWSSEVKPLMMTEDDKIDFDNATQCWIYQKDFTEKDKKVRDHCHFTGKYRGAAHQKCNALFRKPKCVPVKFHHLSGYDAHLFVKNLNTMGEGNIDCIPNTEEKYISFSKCIYDDENKFKYKIRFIGVVSGSYQQVLINLQETSNQTNLNMREKHSVMSAVDVSLTL